MYKVALYSTTARARIAVGTGLDEDTALQLVKGWEKYHNVFIYVENCGKIWKINRKK